MFSTALTSLPANARQSLTDLRLPSLPQRGDVAKKLSGLHATFSRSSSSSVSTGGDSGGSSTTATTTDGDFHRRPTSAAAAAYKRQRRKRMMAAEQGGGGGGGCGGCLARLAAAASGLGGGGGIMGGGGHRRRGEPPEITMHFGEGGAEGKLQSLEPSLPMPEEEEINNRFAELVVSYYFSSLGSLVTQVLHSPFPSPYRQKEMRFFVLPSLYLPWWGDAFLNEP